MSTDKIAVRPEEFASTPVSKDSPVPLYAQLQEILSNYIIRNNIPGGTPFPSEAQISEIFQVSRITARRALNEMVREGLLVRLKGAGNFVASPDTEVQNRERNFCLIADLPPNELFANKFYSQVFQGIYDRVNENGGNLLFSLSHQNVPDDFGLASLIETRAISGIFVLNYTNETLLERIQNTRIPIILVDDNRPGFNRVVTDNVWGAQTAVKYLIKKGHKKIGHMTCDEITSFKERLHGYQSEMRKHNLVPQQEWIKRASYHSLTNEKDAFLELMSLPEEKRPTALFTANDHIAHNVIQTAQSEGIQIPEDLSIVGFDDAVNATPQLTTIQVHKFEMGLTSARLMEKLVETSLGDTECIVLTTELIERDSVCPPKRQK